MTENKSSEIVVAVVVAAVAVFALGFLKCIQLQQDEEKETMCQNFLFLIWMYLKVERQTPNVLLELKVPNKVSPTIWCVMRMMMESKTRA